MRQIFQQLDSGRTNVVEVPAPAAVRGSLSIATQCSLISPGTERMLVEFGRAGWLDKVRQQPGKLRQVLDKIRTDGLLPTIEAVRSKLDQPLPLGYCNVGVVTAVGADVSGFAVGDRVVSNGPHAQIVAVPRNLCARIPAGVSNEAAAFTVLGAIGLQGVRLAAPTLAETFVVTGLGLIGLLSVQLLRANGCRVLGIDPDPAKTALARKFGATTVELANGEDPLAAAEVFSGGRGVDGVLITAATKSSEPMKQAARMCRQRGRIVLVGVAGLELDRADFYEKELSFQVSCSYGPGRYDPTYEQQGIDYPYGLVRWTEQRNFQAVLGMMAEGNLDIEPLITHRFELDDAPRAYDLLAGGGEPYLGIVLNYPQVAAEQVQARNLCITQPLPPPSPRTPVIAFIGAGNYAGRMLIPAAAKTDALLFGIASASGATAAHLGRKFGIAEATTDASVLITHERVNTVMIATRHDTHARFVGAAIAAGKHVFVEKPLAITGAEIDAIEDTWHAVPAQLRPLVMVGFNRRFAPQVVRMKSLLDSVVGPKTLIITVNAGAIPATHWTQMQEGGGRIIGEGCHFIDLMRFLAGAPITAWKAMRLGGRAEVGIHDDKASITLEFADGSIGTLHYFANGHASFPKERIEAFCSGRILQLDNFRRLRGYGWQSFETMNLWRQDKGHSQAVAAFVAAVRDGRAAPIPFDEIIEVARVTVAVGEAIRG